jgi:hypothetical protein
LFIDAALHVNYDPYIVANRLNILIFGKVPLLNLVSIHVLLQDYPCLQPFSMMHVMLFKIIIIVSHFVEWPDRGVQEGIIFTPDGIEVPNYCD